MAEIFFNEKINNYTLDEEIEGLKSIKNVPIKFKLDDNTSKYRKDILREQIFDGG